MTRKDYELIARLFADAKEAPTSFEPEEWLDGFEDGRQQMAFQLASRLADENPAFNMARFLKAAKVDV